MILDSTTINKDDGGGGDPKKQNEGDVRIKIPRLDASYVKNKEHLVQRFATELSGLVGVFNSSNKLGALWNLSESVSKPGGSRIGFSARGVSGFGIVNPDMDPNRVYNEMNNMLAPSSSDKDSIGGLRSLSMGNSGIGGGGGGGGVKTTGRKYDINAKKKSWVKRAIILMDHMSEIRQYAKEIEHLVATGIKLRTAFAFDGGFLVKSDCDTTTVPLFFSMEDNMAALEALLQKQQWYMHLYGFAVVGFVKNPIAWAASASESPEDMVSDVTLDDARRKARSGRNFRIGQALDDTEDLFPCVLLDPVDIGDIVVYTDALSGAIELGIDNLTPIGKELSIKYRFVVYASNDLMDIPDSSGRLMSPVAKAYQKYKEFCIYKAMRDRAAMQNSQQLILVNTNFKMKPDSKLTDHDLNIIHSSTTHDSSGYSTGNVMDDVTARVDMTVDGLNSLVEARSREAINPVATGNTFLSPNSIRYMDNLYTDNKTTSDHVDMTRAKKVIRPMDQLNISDMQLLEHNVLDIPNFQARQIQPSMARIPEIFTVHSVHRPQFNIINMEKEQLEYERTLWQSLGLPIGLMDPYHTSSKTHKTQFGDKDNPGSVPAILKVTIDTTRRSMSSFFNFIYTEAIATLDNMHIKHVISLLKEECGDILFQIKIGDFIEQYMKSNYDLLLQIENEDNDDSAGKQKASKSTSVGNGQSNTKRRKVASKEEEEDVETEDSVQLKQRIDSIIAKAANLKDEKKKEWLNTNYTVAMKVLSLLEQVLNRGTCNVKLIFNEPVPSIVDLTQRKSPASQKK